jgi:hypothetical protein
MLYPKVTRLYMSLRAIEGSVAIPCCNREKEIDCTSLRAQKIYSLCPEQAVQSKFFLVRLHVTFYHGYWS